MISYIKIDADSPVPKYRQLVNSFQEAIESKILMKGQKIPSINELSTTFKLSRDTILTAFYELQAKGVISPKAGKGFYINNNNISQEHKIFLLFDTLTAYKEQLLNAFKDEFSRKGSIDVHFHYFNIKVFENLIAESIGNYTAYVIMPIPSKTVAPSIESIPKDKLFILDRGRRIFGQTYPSVCQSFRKDVFNSLSSGNHLLKKYKKLTLIFPEDGRAPMDLKRGFVQFCTEYGYENIVTSQSAIKIARGEAYLTIDDNTLVHLVRQANECKYVLGKDIGIISYNDTPLKSIAANGITTISTDFSEMGKSMASLVISRKKQHIDNPCRLIVRESL